MSREVIFAPEALTDLFQLYDYIAAGSGAERARNFTDSGRRAHRGFGQAGIDRSAKLLPIEPEH